MSEETSPSEQSEQQQYAEMEARLDGLESEPLVGRYAREVTFDDAIAVLECLQDLSDGTWVFRGHQRACWHLTTELERAVSRMSDWHRAEVWVLQAFMEHVRRHPRDIQNPPGTKDELSWLALARHYGAPTRLLDCTRSPYVAAFFAAAEASRDAPCAIWAMKRSAIAEEASRLLDCHSDAFRNNFTEIFFRATSPPVIAPVEPPCPDERQRAQKALFLCPNSTHWCVGFETSLKYTLQRPANAGEHWLYKIKIQPGARDDLLKKLREERISYETLFPGLDGFARSLRTYVSVRSDDFDYFDGGFGSNI